MKHTIGSNDIFNAYKFGQVPYTNLDKSQIPMLPATRPNTVVMAANTSKTRGSL